MLGTKAWREAHVHLVGRMRLRRDGERYSSFSQCLPLVKAGTDIAYDGITGPLSFTDFGEPGEASYGIAAGAHPKEVQVRAGHLPVALSLDRYGHLFPEADERLRDRLDAFLAAATANPSAPVRSLPGMIPESATAH